MRTLYFQCNSGASGDMIFASLLELLEDKDIFINKFNNIGLENVKASYKRINKSGTIGTKVSITINGSEEQIYDLDDKTFDEYEHHHHHHKSYKDVKDIINNLNISKDVMNNALEIYGIIADAEATVHGKRACEIHFHEVGNLDAIADIVGICMLIEEISPDMIITSPINTGCGNVRCAHGILPVPAPATAIILKNMPIYSNFVEGELCTPTGAAILKHFSDSCGDMPLMKVENIGYGVGTKDLPLPNYVRAFVGYDDCSTDKICLLSCNIDDMTGEEIGFVLEKIMSINPLDLYTQHINMKKNRPSIMISCICNIKDIDKFVDIIFKNTTTLGIREQIIKRHILDREEITKESLYGKIRIKKSIFKNHFREKYEYEDLKKISLENDIPLIDLKNKL